MRVVAATFQPHPRAVLAAGDPPRLLTPMRLRREVLRRYGAEEVVEIPFDLDLSRKSPEQFVRDVLVGELGAAVVVVGENFRFGHRAVGHVEDLGRLMKEMGGEAVAVEVRGVAEQAGISSTRIRSLVSEGRVEEAAGLLGRAFVLRGEVVVGDRRGRTIGFPTANVLPDAEAVVPTFARADSRVEAYLLDFDGDLYGRTVDVGFTHRIRGEKKFSGIDELRAQIQSDVESARSLAQNGS